MCAGRGHEVDPKDNAKAVCGSARSLAALQWLHDRMWTDSAVARAADLSALEAAAQRISAIDVAA